jgi:hypothetical protein
VSLVRFSRSPDAISLLIEQDIEPKELLPVTFDTLNHAKGGFDITTNNMPFPSTP